MTPLQVVLRQPVLEGSAALPSRRADPAPGPLLAARASASEEAREEARKDGHEQGRKAGYEEGLRQGRIAARTEAAARMSELEGEATAQRERHRSELGAVIAALERAVEEWLLAAEEDMVVLCYETIAVAVGRAGVTPEGLNSQVHRVLDQWRGRGVPLVHLHPADAGKLEEARASSPFTWVADPAVSHGGCFVRSEAGGALDARLDRILVEVKAALLAAHTDRALPEETA